MDSNLSIAIIGAGGSGVSAAGVNLIRAVGKYGHYGLLKRSFGPQIRGGESSVV